MDLLEQDLKVEEIEVKLSPFLGGLKGSLSKQGDTDKVKELLPDHIDAIRIFAGGTVTLNDTQGQPYWTSPDYVVGVDSNNLSTGAVYRVGAGAIISKVSPKCKCIVGCNYFNYSQKSPCEVMGEELRLLGVEDERILSDPDTFDTVGEVAKLLQYVGRNSWESVVLVTNFYHKERLIAILDNVDWLVFERESNDDFTKGVEMLRNGLLKFTVVDSEELIKEFDSGLYEEYIGKHMMNDDMLNKREGSESNGINAIKRGEYYRTDPVTNKKVLFKR